MTTSIYQRLAIRRGRIFESALKPRLSGFGKFALQPGQLGIIGGNLQAGVAIRLGFPFVTHFQVNLCPQEVSPRGWLLRNRVIERLQGLFVFTRREMLLSFQIRSGRWGQGRGTGVAASNERRHQKHTRTETTGDSRC